VVRNVERLLLGLASWKWYSVVVRNVERLLLVLAGCKWYSVLVRNFERRLLGLIGCKWYSLVVRMLRDCYFAQVHANIVECERKEMCFMF